MGEIASFLEFKPQTGLLADFSAESFGCRLYAVCGGQLCLSSEGTHYGFVQDGETVLCTDAGEFSLRAGMYFSLPASGVVESSGLVMISTRLDWRGFFSIGGPIEQSGRLRYIDGCADSLLIGPPVKGDPCLNLLHIPPGIDQTQHTHPTLRSGVIVSGGGHCVTTEGSVPLERGKLFAIRPNGRHSFHTMDQELLVIAFHPDSDCGPSHDDHPMINRTIVEGQSARNKPEIATTELPEVTR
ncbi:MAG: cupin domain-containing protein [Verrucomicrobiota bacterium]